MVRTRGGMPCKLSFQKRTSTRDLSTQGAHLVSQVRSPQAKMSMLNHLLHGLYNKRNSRRKKSIPEPSPAKRHLQSASSDKAVLLTCLTCKWVKRMAIMTAVWCVWNLTTPWLSASNIGICSSVPGSSMPGLCYYGNKGRLGDHCPTETLRSMRQSSLLISLLRRIIF